MWFDGKNFGVIAFLYVFPHCVHSSHIYWAINFTEESSIVARKKTLNELTLLDFTIFVCILFMSIPFTLFLSFNRIWDSTHYRKSKFLEFQRESGQFSIFIWDKVSLPESCKNWDFFICFCFYFEWVRVR